MAEISIEKMAKNVAQKAMQELRDNGVFVSRWIPVSEILPKIGTKVLCSVNDHGGYYVIITMYNVQDYWSNGIITAWMPLPEPYKAESEEVDNG